MAIKNIRDLNVWQEAVKLTKGVYITTKNYPTDERFNLIKHLRESARGTAANIAEGFGRYYFKEKLQFYGIARGCLLEVLTDIEISYQVGYVDEELYKRFNNQIEKVHKMLNTLIGNTASKLSYNK